MGENGLVCNVGTAGSVTGGGNAGGIAGSSHGTISHCYNVGDVTGDSNGGNVGGVVGEGSSGGTVSRCYNAGDVSGGSSVGGIIGANWNGSTVNSSFFREGTAVDGIGWNNGSGSAEPRTVVEMRGSGFVDELGAAFAMDPGNLNSGFPVLKGLGYIRCVAVKASVGGSGTSTSRTFVDGNGNAGAWQAVFTRLRANPGYRLHQVFEDGRQVNLALEGWRVSKTGAVRMGEISDLERYTVFFRRDE